MLVAILGAQMAVEYAATYLIKEHMYNSMFSGATWIHELLNGYTTRFYEALGMAKHVFLRLYHESWEHCGLRNSKYLGFVEKAAISL